MHLINAGVDLANITYNGDSVSFATALVARFRERALLEGDRGGARHPMVMFLGYLLSIGPANVGLGPGDVPVLEQLVAETQLRAAALEARRSVGMLEDEQGNGIGTGVVVGRKLVLTCDHIFTKTGAGRARVRFDYKVDSDEFTVSRGTVASLDLAPVGRGGGPQPDYVLLHIADDTSRPSVEVLQGEINSGLAVRLIHHPKCQPAEVSPAGRVVQTGEDYLLHDIPTAVGSSGAPLFDPAWRLVGLHRGNTSRTRAGVSEAVPMHAIWPVIHNLVSPP
jgi:hypothetical protein